MTSYAIALGSNVGDRRKHLVDAHRDLGEQFDVVAVSPIYETEPVGGPDQDPFLNAVIVVETDRGAHDVLAVCHQIEERHGRERKVKWGPRTLDLDVIATDGPAVSTERLTVPHPRAVDREFVLRPLAAVWADAPVGGGGLTARAALASVDGQEVDELVRDWVPPVSRMRGNVLVVAQFALLIVTAMAFAYDGTLPEGEISFLRAIGATVAFLGLIFAFIASRRLGGAMTPSPLPLPDADLVISGPYRFVRHPIYGGLTMFMLGTALFLDSAVGFFAALLLLPFFLVKAGFEERRLRMHHAGYRAYMAVVTRRLIPFVV